MSDTGYEPSPFQRAVRKRQSEWKRSEESELSTLARRPGRWKHVPAVRHILPIDCAEENLWSEIRSELLQVFRERDIQWHDTDGDHYGRRSDGSCAPSPNLCDSQVAAMNFFWPLQHIEGALERALSSAFPDMARVVRVRDGLRLIEPEWVGLDRYLGEHGWPQRGRFATSADMMIGYDAVGGGRHGILIECKYGECYADARLRHRGRSVHRVSLYQTALSRFPILASASNVDVADLLIEPFDQHLRQQLLAAAMENHRELGFETVTVLHVAPRENRPFHEAVTARKLTGNTVADAWRGALRLPERYRSVAYEDLFQALDGIVGLEAWRRYHAQRYGWRGRVPDGAPP